jgi:hypothetical protein
MAVPFRIHTSLGLLSFFSMITVFGGPLEVTLSDVKLSLFVPADPSTAETLRHGAANNHDHKSN